MQKVSRLPAQAVGNPTQYPGASLSGAHAGEPTRSSIWPGRHFRRSRARIGIGKTVTSPARENASSPRPASSGPLFIVSFRRHKSPSRLFGRTGESNARREVSDGAGVRRGHA